MSPHKPEHEHDPEVVEWVEKSCAEQGVPTKVSDLEALRRVATLLNGGAKPKPKTRKGKK